MTAKAPPLVIVQDTREPYPHERVEEPFPPFRCELCGGADRCEDPFVPRFVPRGQSLSIPVRDRERPMEIRRAKLETGDYSLPGLETKIAIERKSLADLVGTVTGSTTTRLGERAENMARFGEELERARELWWFAIVIEAYPEAVIGYLEERFDRRSAKVDERGEGIIDPKRMSDPHKVLGAVRSWSVDYRYPVIWAGSAAHAELEVGCLLARIWEQAHGAHYSRGSCPWLCALAPEVPRPKAPPRRAATDVRLGRFGGMRAGPEAHRRKEEARRAR